MCQLQQMRVFHFVPLHTLFVLFKITYFNVIDSKYIFIEIETPVNVLINSVNQVGTTIL